MYLFMHFCSFRLSPTLVTLVRTGSGDLRVHFEMHTYFLSPAVGMQGQDPCPRMRSFSVRCFYATTRFTRFFFFCGLTFSTRPDQSFSARVEHEGAKE
jgi:hypothetical protein